jgi:uncharacterized protein (DUF1330 family)
LNQSNERNHLIIVAILTLHTGTIESFREYETKAARILSKYGGVIERTVVIEAPSPDERMREVHLLSFPNQESFTRYRSDPDLAALASLRATSIAHTEVLFGREGPDYHALSQ